MVCPGSGECPNIDYRDNNSFKRAVLYLLKAIRDTLQGTIVPSASFVFDALTAIAYTAITAAYTTGASMLAGCRFLALDNQTNGDVMISLDGGTSDWIHMKGGDKLLINFVQFGGAAGAMTVSLKQGTSAPTAGTFYISGIH